MIKSTVIPILTAVVVLILACVSISQCNNYHNGNNHHHPQPCCSDSNCIRVRYNSYTDNYDWYGGCCVIQNNRDTHCRNHPDGYLIAYALCDYRFECYKRNSSSFAAHEDKITASLTKVNQTLLNPYIEVK